jgi:hypothetical protein
MIVLMFARKAFQRIVKNRMVRYRPNADLRKDMNNRATELVFELAMELGSQAIRLVRDTSVDWQQVYVRYSAPNDTESGWKGSYVTPSGVHIFDVLQATERGRQILHFGRLLREAMAKEGKKFLVCLVRANSDLDLRIDFEWSDETKWNLTKQRGGTGLPEGVKLLTPLG